MSHVSSFGFLRLLNEYPVHSIGYDQFPVSLDKSAGRVQGCKCFDWYLEVAGSIVARGTLIPQGDYIDLNVSQSIFLGPLF